MERSHCQGEQAISQFTDYLDVASGPQKLAKQKSLKTKFTLTSLNQVYGQVSCKLCQ